MRDPRSQSAQEIKDEIAKVPQPILNVVTKDVKGPHVAKQVKETAVQEHKGEKSDHLLARGEVDRDLRGGIAGRDKAINIDELIESLPQRQFHKKYRDIDRNDDNVNYWIGI
jgi:hypothetical protein